MYIGVLTGEGLPWEYHVWMMAERFGWTLEYIDALSLARWHELIQVDDGRATAGRSKFGK